MFIIDTVTASSSNIFSNKTHEDYLIEIIIKKESVHLYNCNCLATKTSAPKDIVQAVAPNAGHKQQEAISFPPTREMSNAICSQIKCWPLSTNCLFFQNKIIITVIYNVVNHHHCSASSFKTAWLRSVSLSPLVCIRPQVSVRFLCLSFSVI